MILGTSRHQSSMLMVMFDSQCMISYLCSVVSLGLDGAIVKLHV